MIREIKSYFSTLASVLLGVRGEGGDGESHLGRVALHERLDDLGGSLQQLVLGARAVVDRELLAAEGQSKTKTEQIET